MTALQAPLDSNRGACDWPASRCPVCGRRLHYLTSPPEKSRRLTCTFVRIRTPHSLSSRSCTRLLLHASYCLSPPPPLSCTPRVCFTSTQSSLHQCAARTLPHAHISSSFRTYYDTHVPPTYQVPLPLLRAHTAPPHFASVIIHCSTADRTECSRTAWDTCERLVCVRLYPFQEHVCSRAFPPASSAAAPTCHGACSWATRLCPSGRPLAARAAPRRSDPVENHHAGSRRRTRLR